MLQPHLELIGYTDDLHNKSAPPLLFVHGAWHGAWCWDKHFLLYFSQNGYRSYALSLRGHGQSYQPQPFWKTGIAQYVHDVETIIAQLPQIPIVIGHSMGGFIVQKLLEKNSPLIAGAALLAPVPHFGAIKIILKMAALYPIKLLLANVKLSLYGFVNTPELVKKHFFSPTLPTATIQEYASLMQDEAYRIMWDMLLLQLPKQSNFSRKIPLLVLGAANDFLISPDDVQKTALAYGATATILPNIAHDLMLDTNWQTAAQTLLLWLNTLSLTPND